MSALFPTFLSLGQRLKRLLANDIKSIWQALEDTQEPTGQEFFDGFIYHPPFTNNASRRDNRCLKFDTSVCEG
jgi:hypothetical protein